MFFTVKFVARLTLCCLTSSAALACGDGKVLFEDNFQTLLPTWLFDAEEPSRSNGPEGLTYALKPDTYRAKLHKASLYDDYEVCATFTADFVGEEESGTYSAYMWASDIDNSYGVSISPFGTFAVFRLQRGKYLAQTLWNESTAIQKGEKAQNEISVAVKGKHATVSINGTKVYEFDATPPDNGSLPGFDMTAFKTNKNDMKMTLKRFEVREVK